jgi:hypothetical protein
VHALLARDVEGTGDIVEVLEPLPLPLLDPSLGDAGVGDGDLHGRETTATEEVEHATEVMRS